MVKIETKISYFLLFMVAFVFADPCDPTIYLLKMKNMPDNMCSEDIFIQQKHFNSIGCPRNVLPPDKVIVSLLYHNCL